MFAKIICTHNVDIGPKRVSEETYWYITIVPEKGGVKKSQMNKSTERNSFFSPTFIIGRPHSTALLQKTNR